MKYVAYYRVSTKKQGDSGLGLESQETYINHFYQDDIVKSFTDVKSGKDIEGRPELQKAIALCKEKGYTLVVAKIDRLSRKTEDALNIFNELEERLASCDIPSLDKFTLTMFMAIADRERELIGIRTKAALAARKARGEAWKGKANITGAARVKATEAIKEKAAKNENNKRAVKMICALRSQLNEKGKPKTYAAIATELNDSDFKTSKGKEFQAIQVKRLFDRYCNC